ncbi:MAG: hypothetical protein WCH99_16855 [Verrucomicrobiota bacterium]
MIFIFRLVAGFFCRLIHFFCGGSRLPQLGVNMPVLAGSLWGYFPSPSRCHWRRRVTMISTMAGSLAWSVKASLLSATWVVLDFFVGVKRGLQICAASNHFGAAAGGSVAGLVEAE